ncbi:BTB/POZ domain-containing protein At1g55760-like [Gastrolobium bilobum]|uniref:BTB/POZ domain-containing protein At1g55760-like n=1 Tax=Gastrolobium bilobum TaxID=150636 RepID=UPI002AAF6A6D|nr:BTB/POZ domain-containing protein At1g55760-like [Gastrolobium bilobum]
MLIEACVTFLNYLYESIKVEEFLSHRVALLHITDKYDISDLNETCNESLVEDIHAKFVLVRLQVASQYPLPKLKIIYIQYLIKLTLGMISMPSCTVQNLISKVFNEVLDV